MTTSASVPPPRDPGLQAERTALAWNRTGMAILVNALLVLRAGLSSERHAITTLALVLMLAAGALFVFGAWRRRHLIGGHGHVAPPTLAPVLTTIVTMAACAAGIASILR
jgi:uncharacterized membrane protein YidH (DUF202 family)